MMMDGYMDHKENVYLNNLGSQFIIVRITFLVESELLCFLPIQPDSGDVTVSKGKPDLQERKFT